MDRSDNLIASLVCFGAAFERFSAAGLDLINRNWIGLAFAVIGVFVALWAAVKLLREALS